MYSVFRSHETLAAEGAPVTDEVVCPLANDIGRSDTRKASFGSRSGRTVGSS